MSFSDANTVSGRLAAKWISDLVQGVVASESFACNPSHSHNLHTVTTQSSHEHELVVCICNRCKKTLEVSVGCTGDRCRPNIERMHHLVSLGEDELEPAAKDNKYYPVISRATYICSAARCTLTVSVQVCGPRLPVEYEAALLDQQAVLDKLQELVVKEPSRFEDLQAPDRLGKLVPANYLMQYLNDALSLDPEKPRPLRVSVRNKFFQVCFSDRFEKLFEFLEFEVTGQDSEKFMQLPVLDDEPPQPSQVTPSGSRRAWFEILRTHLSFLLDDIPNALKAPIDVRIQHSTKESLAHYLHAKYAKTSFVNVADYNPEDFNLLGVEKDMHEVLLWYAGICQKQTNPPRRQEIFNALSRVSRGREGSCYELRTFLEEEAIELATLASANDARPTPLSRAYRMLKITEDSDDTAVEEAFTDALSSSVPEERKSARLNLAIVARARASDKLLQMACTFEDVRAALEFLELSPDTSPEFVRSVLVTYETESWFDKALVASAVRELARQHDGHLDLIEYAHHLQSKTDSPWAEGENLTVARAEPASQDIVDFTLPVGLVNIRNTCYLNSILQYFNTVVPVRNVILNWEEYKLEPTEENISSRRLGGSGSTLDKAEAFLASKFVEEMRSLFLQLQTSSASSVRPEQRLALAALNTPYRLIKDVPTTKAATVFGPPPNPNANKNPFDPPSLPPRPSAKLSAETHAQPTETTVTVTPIADSPDTASNVSSVTLVDQRDGDSDHTNVTTIPPAIPAKQRSPLDDDDKERGRSANREQDDEGGSDVRMSDMNDAGEQDDAQDSLSIEEKITKALADKTVTGTDQQDVEEVMGNVLEHLHAAIRPTGTDENTGKQTDIITETFYWSSIKYIRKVDLSTGRPNSDYRSVKDLSRWMTAFPANAAKVDLYTALDSSFDREYQEDGRETFTSITNAPPILHIYIQRIQNNNGQLTRNNHIVEIPEVLSLDRYMDGDNESEVLKRRQRSWNLKRRLKALDGRTLPPESSKDQTKKDDVKETDYEVINKDVDTFEEAFLSLDTGEGEDEEEFVSILDSEQQRMLVEHGLFPPEQPQNGLDVEMHDDYQGSLIARLDPEAAKSVTAKGEEERSKIEAELSTLFDDMNDVTYRLHAVICQTGKVNAGHYWVWIYDFGANIWRKYNDTTVEVYADTATVLRELNSNGDPYYLAYVRDTNVGELVTIPERSRPEGDGRGLNEDTRDILPGNTDDGSGANFGDGNGTVSISDLQHTSGFVDDSSYPLINGIVVDVDMEDAQVMHVEDRGD